MDEIRLSVDYELRHSRNDLSDFDVGLYHDGPLGRCPICGTRTYLPCIACMAQRALIDRAHCTDSEEIEDLALDLHYREFRRYRTVRRPKSSHKKIE